MICYSYNEKSLGEAVRKQRGESTEGKRYAWGFFLIYFYLSFWGWEGATPHGRWDLSSYATGLEAQSLNHRTTREVPTCLFSALLAPPQTQSPPPAFCHPSIWAGLALTLLQSC